jgi:catechol 2,3-dioxygenase-like lactoylglutathione lyase family enzyme
MRTKAHHVALRVSDCERSRRFYTEALGGRVVLDLQLDSEFVESIFSAPAGNTARNIVMMFDPGAIELFEMSPSEPLPPADQTRVGIMHFCLWVDDVVAAANRVEAAGGRLRFPVRPWADGHHFVYVEDPDGHVIELLDATMEECVVLSGESLPDIHQAAASS